MTEKEWVLGLWRLMIEFVRLFGRKNGLCTDIKIIKDAK